MKYLMFLIVVGVTTAAIIPLNEPVGKKLAECEGRSNKTNTHNVRHETNCHQFYKCLGGYGFVIDCPEIKNVKLVFNEESLVCDWEGVPCSDVPNVPPGSDDPTKAPGPDVPTTTKPPSGVQPPNCAEVGNRNQPHEDCDKFYYCESANSGPLVGQCPEGTHFNAIVAQCDLGECKKKD
ncbi:peritrophin-1 [Osmia lignaria lignaria]|uniref:peritrophin-1 n=1 Tax=Osmia lignaria lignaria TaxID=1437193 RepID=UPI00402BC2E8